jgi:hypothetical protein
MKPGVAQALVQLPPLTMAGEKRRDRGGVRREIPQSAGRAGWTSAGWRLKAARHELAQVLGGDVRQLADAEVVDDEERHDGEIRDIGCVLEGRGENLANRREEVMDVRVLCENSAD